MNILNIELLRSRKLVNIKKFFFYNINAFHFSSVSAQLDKENCAKMGGGKSQSLILIIPKS